MIPWQHSFQPTVMSEVLSGQASWNAQALTRLPSDAKDQTLVSLERH